MQKTNSSSDDGSLKIAFFFVLFLFFSLFLGFSEGETQEEGIAEEREAVISSLDIPKKEEKQNAYNGTTIPTSSSPTFHNTQEKMEESEPRVVEKRWVEVTGYSSTVDQTNSQPFITASGARVREDIIAANFLEFGTEIRMPELFGDRVFTVKDRMNRRYSPPYDHVWHDGYVDIWFPTRQDALRLGRQTTYIEIIR